MNTLILDCSAGMSIYLLVDGEVEKYVDENQKKHTDQLLLEVDRLLSKMDLNVSNLDNICVCVGPGSFTGIRVAAAVCKGLAIGTNAKVLTCSNFDCLSFNLKSDALVLLEAFSDYVYVREISGGKISDYCEHFDKVASNIQGRKNIFVQNEKLQNLLKNNEIQSQIAQNHIIDLFLSKIQNKEFVQVDKIIPIYLRASQAEIEREKRLNGEK